MEGRNMNLTESLVTQNNVNEISARFDLTEEQTLEAMGAVIPAFSEALKRHTNTPDQTARLLKALSSGRHTNYAVDPAMEVETADVSEGNAILGHLFGSKQLSRAVASQAATSTGISPDLFRQLLPAMASMVMGSLFKGATDHQVADNHESGDSASEAAVGGGLLGQIIEGIAGGLLEGAGSATKSRRSRRARRGSGSLEDILEQVMGGRSTTRKKRRTPTRRRRQAPKGGLEDLLESLLGGERPKSSTQRRQRRTASPPRPERRSQGQSSTPGGIFGDMLEAGGTTSKSDRRKTSSIFDEFLDG
jgi:hypothetical protein